MERVFRIKIDHEIAESFGKLRPFFDELKEIVNRGCALTEREQTVLMMAAIASLQKMTMDIAMEDMYLSV